ncbi:hypothetical protein CFIMG_007343RA00001 [Ceratocystis fimbriata CBS 114723]|uniref:Uncharacterized protein n=1 Tax=Ceratocystis fimbriata CBS 114723 TaxID=1035309 RepID=A0A2C5WYB5_9PEZI|nr:hypothetical protein CFIMG_007343RA00001 [Ceratocystis fimbriata CBS 114723]
MLGTFVGLARWGFRTSFAGFPSVEDRYTDALYLCSALVFSELQDLQLSAEGFLDALPNVLQNGPSDLAAVFRYIVHVAGERFSR